MRKITPAMKDYLDARCADRTDLTPRKLLIHAAQNLIGITAGANADIVNEMRSTITKPWGEAWCVDFVQTCVAYVEAARGVQSTLPATEGVLDLWNKSQPLERTVTPMPGDLILWRLGQTLEGHCGLIVDLDSLLYYTVEGNTSESVGIVRDGNGVFAKKRAIGGTKTFSEVGFLRCFP